MIVEMDVNAILMTSDTEGDTSRRVQLDDVVGNNTATVSIESRV